MIGAELVIHEVALETQGRLRTEWVRLRHALWNDGLEPLDAQLRQLAQAKVPYVGFLACTFDDQSVAFAEASLRPYANGCETSPVVFLEGLYVQPAFRRQGVARLLVDRVAAWGAAAGCTEFGSDILEENRASHATHLALGFTETERIIYFRKLLK